MKIFPTAAERNMLHYHYIRKVRKTMNQYHYEVGDIVKLKKQHPCRSGFPPEMQGLRTPDHDCKKACGEKYQRTAQDGGDGIGTLRSFLRFFQEITCNYGENVL